MNMPHFYGHWLKSLGYPVPAETSKYKVVPTCDVDAPYYWRTGPFGKYLQERLRKTLIHFVSSINCKNSNPSERIENKIHLISLNI
jgi:hypothetical protein